MQQSPTISQQSKYDDPSYRKLIVAAIWGLSSTPLLCALNVIFFAVRARRYLGYWPRPNGPDPKTLPFEIQHELLWRSGEVTAIAIGAMLLLGSISKSRKFATRSSWILLVIGMLLIAILVLCPPVDFVMWFLD